MAATPSALSAALRWMIGDASPSIGVIVCGVDTESFKRKVELIQFCVEDRAVLVHRSSGLVCSAPLAAFLDGSFADAGLPVVFSGAELVGDAAMLLADGLVMHRCLDVTPLYSALYGQGSTANAGTGDGSPSRGPLPPASSQFTVGLRRMFEETFGVKWAKDKAVTVSDWSAPALVPLQVQYAVQASHGALPKTPEP